MGWLWTSSSPPKPAADKPETWDAAESSSNTPAPPEQRNFGLTEEQRTRIFGQPNAQPTDGGSREEKADAELDAFLKSFGAADTTPSAPSTVTSPDPQTPSHAAPEQTTPPPTYDRFLPDGSVNIHPTAIYPRTMSCRQAFDQAFYCQSAGGKFNDIYRYGYLKDCSEQWGAFWFCMRTRTLPDKDKEGMVSDYYAERDARRRKEFGSSEDVWELREKAVERAFWRDPNDLDDVDGREVQVRE